MVNSGGVLTSDAITQAMARGDFYASSGVALKSIVHSDQEYSVCIDSLQTLVEIASPHVVGKDVSEGESGFLVEFIGSNGKVLSVSNDLDASYQINATEGYIRARITYTQSLEDGKFRQFFAWTQPRFLDHRADQLLNDVVSPK